MYRTLDTESDEDEGAEYRYGLAFLVSYTEDGITIDACIDVSPVLGQTHVGMLAAEKLTGIKNEDAPRVAAGLGFLELRRRFLHGAADPGPYLFRTQDPMTRDELENFLRSCEPSRRKALLKQARI